MQQLAKTLLDERLRDRVNALWPVMVILALIPAAVHAPRALAASLASNAGWLALIRAQFEPDSGRAWGEAFSWFYEPARGAPLNASGYVGAGIYFALEGEEELAQAAWRRGAARPGWLVNLGDQAADVGNYGLAMRYYRGAYEVTNQKQSSADLSHESLCETALDDNTICWRIGHACQLGLYAANVLSDQQRNSCKEFFANNGDNLVINGQFDRPLLEGWEERVFSSERDVRYSSAVDVGVPSPAASLEGISDAYHGGIFQLIYLPPKSKIRYSASIRVSDATDNASFQARILAYRHVGRGRVQTLVGSLPRVSERGVSEWTKVECFFVTPNSPDTLAFLFFPVLIEGHGTIWVDDVRVEILPDAPAARAEPSPTCNG